MTKTSGQISGPKTKKRGKMMEIMSIDKYLEDFWRLKHIWRLVPQGRFGDKEYLKKDEISLQEIEGSKFSKVTQQGNRNVVVMRQGFFFYFRHTYID